MMRQSTIAIIGAPMDLGSGRRGVDMGPSAIRVANIHSRIASLGYKVEDLGNVAVEQAESSPTGPKRARYLAHIAETCLRLAEKVERAAGQGKVPLVLGAIIRLQPDRSPVSRITSTSAGRNSESSGWTPTLT